MNQQRPFDTTEQEYAYHSGVVPPYVQPEDRNHRYPTLYPVPIDKYRIEWWRPIIAMGEIDAGALYDVAVNGWKRCGDASKRKWAFRAPANAVPFNLAAANGHPSGMVGITGTLATEEMNPELGGGYILTLKHLAPIS